MDVSHLANFFQYLVLNDFSGHLYVLEKCTQAEYIR